MYRFLIALILLSVTSPGLAGADIHFEEDDGLFIIRYNTLTLVTTDYVFWDEDWKWAGAVVQTSTKAPLSYEFGGESARLGLRFAGKVKKTAPNQMTWTFDLATSRSKKNAIGGGIVFKLGPRVEQSGLIVAPPEMLPGNSGWRIKIGPNDGFLSIRFDPPVERLFFERGNRGEIRAFFYDGSIEPGRKKTRMIVTLPRDGEVVPTLHERLGPGPDKNWYREVLYWATSPVDLSFLNEPERPAGKRGFLAADGENFVFEDGTRAKFWGINLMANALFQTNSVDVRRQAKRLSKLGFNLVRFHHHDSAWVQPNVFGNNAGNTRNLDPAMMKKIDWWIKALKDEGIYVWLDINVGREFTAKDGIRNFKEIAKGKISTMARGFTHINPAIQERLMEFQEAYLSHVNSFTSLAYKDDPAIIAFLITNENDLTGHNGNQLLPNQNVPAHNAIYMAEAATFAAKNRLPVGKTWRSWEQGPAKIFLNDLEHRFNAKMIRHLEAIGAVAPIATTQSWGYMPISSLPALSDGDIIDVHSYGRANEVETNPRYVSSFLNWVSAAQVVGKPLSISEWNLSPFPAFDRSQLPLQVATMARLQAWDASMQYGYSHIPINSIGRPSNWVAYNDPAMLAMMPAAALMYRQGHVQEAKKSYTLKLDPHTFFYGGITPYSSTAIRTIMEQSRFSIELPETPELPWLKPAKADDESIIVTDPNKNFLPAGQNFVRSDTGEIYRNWEEGIFTVNTDKSQVAAGWLGGKSVQLKDISVDLVTKYAAVAVQSMSEKPIVSSENILISLSARSVLSSGDKLPFLSEPLLGLLKIRAPEGLFLFSLDRSGKGRKVDVEYRSGHYLVRLNHELGTYWLRLSRF